MSEIDDSYDSYDDAPYERRYRPGRGGFDPYAAELAARAKYAFRQRVVLLLLILALATGLFAGFAMPLVWWGHAAVDLTLVGYLAYLRRQVRIEQEIRQRRLARAGRTRRAITAGSSHSQQRPPQRRREELDDDHAPDWSDDEDDMPPEAVEPPPPPPRPAPRPATPPGTAVLDLDDEDPHLHELDTEAPTPYRRAVGE